MKKILLLVPAVFFILLLNAQTWNGTTNTDWNTPDNWTGGVPLTTGNVIIPAGAPRYPVLASNITINSIDMQTGSEIDVNGFTLTLDGSNSYIYFTGATLNNSNGSTDIVLNINTGAGGFVTFFRSNTVNDNITFNLTGSNQFNEADLAASANTYNGNASFNINGSILFYLSHLSASNFNGNLTVNRTVAGTTQFFNGGAAIIGNFSYTNNTTGSSIIGNTAIATAIGGTVNIAANYSTNNAFNIYRLINQTTGGTINIQNSTGFDIQKNTLKVTSLSVTGYKTGQYGNFLNNNITGNVTIADDATYTGGYVTYIRNNIVTGTSSFTNNGSNEFFDADIPGTANIFNGNTSYTATNSGALYISHNSTSNFNGNLTVNRTAAGTTQLFNTGAVITGNFSYTNNTSGLSSMGSIANATTITGTINIAASYTTNNGFAIYRLINQTTGGTINIQNTTGFDIQNDTLKVTSLSVTGYKTGQYGYFLNNNITGNVTIADDASYSGGYVTYIRNNIVTGTSSFSNNGSNALSDSDIPNSSNTYNGNTVFAASNSGSIGVSNGAASQFNGNLTINRTSAGSTQFFNSGAAITGNFSYTNNTSGTSTFGNAGFATSIGGTVNIAASYTSNSGFAIYRLINQTTGGTINIQNTTGFDIQNDTLKLTSLSVTGYKTGQYGYFLNNDITGNVTIADDATYSGGYATYIRNNIITGNSSFSNNGSNVLYDAESGGFGNKYAGNVTYIRNGSGPVSVAAGSIDEITQNLTLNSASGITLGKIKFNGGTNGIVEQLGTQAMSISELTMEKTGTGKITLNDSVTVSTILSFNGGNMISNTTDYLIFLDNATSSGSSATSHVIGPVIKIGDDVFTFPLGSPLSSYNPVAMTAPVGTSSRFSAEYLFANPANVGDTALKAPAFKRISGCEYWDVKRIIGTSSVTLTFSFGNPCSGAGPVYITDPTKINIAHWTGAIWEDLGNGGSTGTTSGTVTTMGPVSSFSAFTFGSTNALVNPLPLTLINFDATQCNNDVCMTFETQNELNFSHFEVEKSNNANNFTRFETVLAKGNAVNKYIVKDNQPFEGISYYRLKMVDKDGRFTYSSVRKIDFSKPTIISVQPNPAKNVVFIKGTGGYNQLRIFDLSGKLILQKNITGETAEVNISAFVSGIYMVQLMNDEKVTTIKLIRD